MPYTKDYWLTSFRKFAEGLLESLLATKKDRNYKAKEINRQINSCRNGILAQAKQQANSDAWTNERLLDEILRITYASYVVMLEYRNKVWPYEYMTFSRRIGELWEPFCKLAFEHPIKALRIIKPPEFKQVQQKIQKSATEYIDSLEVSQEIKDELKRHYSIP